MNTPLRLSVELFCSIMLFWCPVNVFIEWSEWENQKLTGHHWNWSDPESRRGGGGRISRGGARPPVSPPAWAAKHQLTLNKPRTWYSLDNHEHILRPAWLTQHGTLNLSASIAVSRFGLAVSRRYWGSVVSGRTSAVRYRFAALLSLQKGCGLWTLSKLWHCPSLPTETLIWLSSLPILMQKSFWWWQCSDRYIYWISLSPHLIVQELCESRGGRPGLSVLTSLLVSVDVKIYWTVLRHWSQPLVPNMSNDIWGH